MRLAYVFWSSVNSLSKIVSPFGVVLACLLMVSSQVDAQTASPVDYDIDNDRLIEISNLEQLDAVRYDLDGNGASDSNDTRADYLRAFPSPTSRMGCSAGGCVGYELSQGLDFNDPGSYASGSVDRGWSRGEGDESWLPIGSHFTRFGAILEGNGHTVANLYIDRDVDYVGLFGGISSQGSIRRIGLVEARVGGIARVGTLAGASDGAIIDCYASGNVSATDRAGGLVGENSELGGSIIGSYSTANVLGEHLVGGLAGGNWGTIVGSHAAGRVKGTSTVGGLAGNNAGSIGTSYATGRVTGTRSVGGLGRVHTKRSASKMSANEMNPRKITSSFSKREKMRRNPFNRRNSLSISLRLLYISRSYSHG